MAVPIKRQTSETWYSSKSAADRDADYIRKFETDNWQYAVQPLGASYFVIVVYDEDGEFVGRL